MRLTRIQICNHSRIVDSEIEVRAHLVLVGPNDVGKSSLLRCLDFLLGASTAQLYNRVTVDDFADPTIPFFVEADLTDLDATDQAHFPDETTVDPVTADLTLTLRLEVSIDANGTVVIDRRAPNGNTGRQLSRAQREALGWKLLGATAMARDLREDRRSPLDDILQGVDLGGEKATFDAIVGNLQTALQVSPTLEKLRTDLSGQLSKALPVSVAKDDLSLESGAVADGDVLADVRLRVTKGGKTKDISEQSDGLRALYALALYDLVSVGSNMVAVDEPEIHLHPTSQRSLSRLLRTGPNQKLLATHSPDVVSAFPTDCIVSVRAGGVLVQPNAGFLSVDEKLVVRWWVRDKLEPLTANRVLAVEGISDRIIVERVADLTGHNLDRLGVSVLQTDGSADMPAVLKLFGPTGFDLPLNLLIDEDARPDTAKALGVAPADLEKHSVFVSARVAVAGLSPLFIGSGRAVLAATLAAAALTLTRQPLPSGRQWARLAVVAAGVVVGFPLLTSYALTTVTAAHGAMVIALLPAATAVTAVLRGRERPRRAFWSAAAAGAAAAVGFAWAQGDAGGGLHVADLLLFGAVVSAAVGYAEGGLLARELGAWQTVSWALVLAAPLMTVLAAVSAVQQPPEGTVTQWAAFAYLGIVSMFLGFFAWYRGLAIGPMTSVSQVQLLQPVLSLCWAALLLSEQITWVTAVGGLVVVLCAGAAVRSRPPVSAPHLPDPGQRLAPTRETECSRD